jgi:DedD protein
MAFFKIRKGSEESQAISRQPESIEAMRRRARHRLIGAGVLVLIGVIGFPLLFDTQPRPIAVDIRIEIPDRNKVKPLAAPPAPAAALASAGPPPVVRQAQPASTPQVKAEAEVKPEPEPKAEAKSEHKVAAKPEPKVPAKSAAPADEGDKAKALLEGKPASTAAATADGRFVVQIGAFADSSKAREARLKVERAGLKTYTHVAETKEGQRIRVRVGPFGSRTEADKAAERIKGLALPASVLTL